MQPPPLADLRPGTDWSKVATSEDAATTTHWYDKWDLPPSYGDAYSLPLITPEQARQVLVDTIKFWANSDDYGDGPGTPTPKESWVAIQEAVGTSFAPDLNWWLISGTEEPTAEQIVDALHDRQVLALHYEGLAFEANEFDMSAKELHERWLRGEFRNPKDETDDNE
jgi:hypothetical protein